MQLPAVKKAFDILERTPDTLRTMLGGLMPRWLITPEGADSWSVRQVVGHLLFCEQQNFFLRIQSIRGGPDGDPIPIFDMSAQFDLTADKDCATLLSQFAILRQQNLLALREKPLTLQELGKTGLHHTMGPVTLLQVLCTWAAHDLAHTAQVMRIMAKQYKEDVGPFIQFLRILH